MDTAGTSVVQLETYEHQNKVNTSVSCNVIFSLPRVFILTQYHQKRDILCVGGGGKSVRVYVCTYVRACVCVFACAHEDVQAAKADWLSQEALDSIRFP